MNLEKMASDFATAILTALQNMSLEELAGMGAPSARPVHLVKKSAAKSTTKHAVAAKVVAKIVKKVPLKKKVVVKKSLKKTAKKSRR